VQQKFRESLNKVLLLILIGVISIIATTGFTIAETSPVKTTPVKTTSTTPPTIITSPVTPPTKIPTSNIKSSDVESATSIKTTIVTSTGLRTEHNFQKVIQWTLQQAHSDRSSPQLELDSIPSMDKGYLYDMVKRKFENDPKISDVVIFLDAITKDNKTIVSTKYSGCQIDQYWLWTDTDKEQYRFSKADAIEPHEQFFFKCTGYSVNAKH